MAALPRFYRELVSRDYVVYDAKGSDSKTVIARTPRLDIADILVETLNTKENSY